MMTPRLSLPSVCLLAALAPARAGATPWEFRPGVTLPGNPGLVTQKLALADMNQDGWVDVLVANSAGDSVGGLGTAQLNQLLLNLEGAAFSEIPAFKTKDNAFTIKAGDVDNDGDLDLVVGDNFGGGSYTLLNEFPEFVRVDIPTPITVGDLELGDITGDGDLDVVFATWGGSLPFGAPNDPGGPVLVAVGNGLGSFAVDPNLTPQGPDNLVSWSFDVELVDFDNDFDLDVFVASRGPGPAIALRNDEGVLVGLPVPAMQPVGGKPINTAFLPIDLEQDGFLDLFTLQDGPLAGACSVISGVNLCAQNNAILRNDGAGGFFDDPAVGFGAGANPAALDFDAVNLDIDGDNRMDVLVAGFRPDDGQPNARLLRDSGGSEFVVDASLNPALPQVPELARAFGLELADFDRDGREDVAVAVRDATQPNAVLFGGADPVNGVPIDTNRPFTELAAAIIDPTFGQVITVEARAHDFKIPADWHDFAFDEAVPTYNNLTATAVVHKRRSPYLEFAFSLSKQEFDVLPDDSPLKFIVVGEWYGEALWRFRFIMPFAGKLLDPLVYRVCAIDTAGNRGCTAIFSTTVQVDPDTCGDGELQPWEPCDDDLDPKCFQCKFSCGDGFCQVPDENQLSCPEDCVVCDVDGICEGQEDPNNCPSDCTCDFDGVCEAPSESGVGCPNDCPICDFDGVCEPPEDGDNCPSDCQFCDFDGICEPPEDALTCMSDCPECDFDGICDPGENGDNCPFDCELCDFDGICDPFEDSFTCPFDCGEGVVCGDGLCNGGEDANTCPIDCACNFDGFCDFNEDSFSCPTDCPGVCGNGVCEPSEDASSCAPDCGTLGCGDGVCASEENAQQCPLDCPPPPCGDGLCDPGETIASCPQDCIAGDCGDGVCDPRSEENASCPLDCRGECGNGECELNEDCPEDCETGGDECPDGAPSVDGVCQGAGEDGCGCRESEEEDRGALLGLGLVALALRRRRRR